MVDEMIGLQRQGGPGFFTKVKQHMKCPLAPGVVVCHFLQDERKSDA